MAPNDQAIAQILSIIDPEQYKRHREIVDHWRWHSEFGGLMKTERQCFTMKAVLHNVTVQPHYDNQRGWTTSQVFGDYEGDESAGMLYVPEFDEKFEFSPRSLLFMEAHNNQHGVGIWTNSKRYCLTQYLPNDMADLEHNKTAKYPDEDRAEKRAAKEAEVAEREANGEPGTIDACPFCSQAIKDWGSILRHLLSYMNGKKTDDKHGKDETAHWILKNSKRRGSRGKTKRKSKAVDAAKEYLASQNQTNQDVANPDEAGEERNHDNMNQEPETLETEGVFEAGTAEIVQAGTGAAVESSRAKARSIEQMSEEPGKGEKRNTSEGKRGGQKRTKR